MLKAKVMGEKPQDLKPRTKEFALRVICMFSKLPKNDTVAQVLGKVKKFCMGSLLSQSRMTASASFTLKVK